MRPNGKGEFVKRTVIAALVAAQLVAGQPAFAQEVGNGPQTRVGMFAGVSVSVPIGGSRDRAEASRASFGIAPTARSERIDGASRTVIGEGLQLSLTPNRPIELNLAGTRLDRFRLTPGVEAPGGPRNGVSTLGWIAIGVGATAVILVTAAAICLDDNECNPSE